MENKDQFLTSVTSILSQVVQYASGGNPDGRDFFQEMERDPNFQKSFKEFEAQQQKQGATDAEVVQAQLINLMVEEDIYRMGAGQYRYYDEELLRSSAILRKAGRSEAPLMIKSHRRLQLASFGRLAQKEEQGVIIKHKDPDHKPSDKERQEMKKWGDILANKFFFLNGDRSANLGRVLGAAYEDFFDLDKIAFYIWRQKNNTPLGMILVDSALVKYIVPKRYEVQRWDEADYKEMLSETKMDIKDFYEDEYRFLIVNKYHNRVAKFTPKSMIVSHFFKRSAVDDTWKGNSIIEQAVRVVSSIINSIELNSSRMTNNRMPQGVMALTGAANMSPLVVEKFKKLLWAQSMGANNAWRIPIISLPDKNAIQWVPFHQSNRDMEFFNWMSLLFTIVCRLSGTDPEELSLASNRGSMEGKGALFQQGQEGVQRRSRDNGLRTYLDYFAEIVNDSGVVRDLTGQKEWLFGFSGLDVKDEAAKADLNLKYLQTQSSINELLAAEDKKTFKLELGGMNVFDIPAIGNQNVYQLVMAAIQQKQQEEMMAQQQEQMAAQGGVPGAEGQPAEGQEEQLEGEQLPEFSEQDLKLLQEYGIGKEEDREAVRKSLPFINQMMKRKPVKKQPEIIQLVIED